VRGLVFAAEHDSEHKWEALPAGWKPDVQVEGRREKHRLYLGRSNGSYVRFIITGRTKAPKVIRISIPILWFGRASAAVSRSSTARNRG